MNRKEEERDTEREGERNTYMRVENGVELCASNMSAALVEGEGVRQPVTHEHEVRCKARCGQLSDEMLSERPFIMSALDGHAHVIQ